MRQGLLSEPKASSGPAAMLLAVSRSPSSIPRWSPCPDRCHLPLASPSPSTHKTSTASTTASTPGPMPPSSGVPLSIHPQNLNSIHDCIHSRTDATFLWRPSLHPPHRPIPSFSSVPLYLQQNKKSPAPSKYNTTRHQRKKNKCQADIHNPLRYLLITE